MTDWTAIETEYITTATTYRALAQKYGLSEAAVARRAGAGDWVGKRRRQAGETQGEIIRAVEAEKVSRAVRLQSVADILLDRVAALLGEPDRIGASDLRNLSSVLKSLKDIQMIRSDADVREQEAKIRNLERQAQKEDNEPIRVFLDPGLTEYSG